MDHLIETQTLLHEQNIDGGGVACYIRSDIQYEILEAPQITDFKEIEYMLISLNLDQQLILASVYRRPKGNVLNDFFIMLLNYVHLYNSIITGDLNSDLLDCNNYYGTHLKNHIYENSLYLVPFNGATHHSEDSDTWIDVMITDWESKVIPFQKSLSPFICGHDYLIMEYQLDIPVAQDTNINTRL